MRMRPPQGHNENSLDAVLLPDFLRLPSRRATDAQVLEDAERLIAAWNERQAKRMPMPFSPTIRFADVRPQQHSNFLSD